jgi:hypothetical protein
MGDYWQSSEEELPRIQRVMNGVQKYVKNKDNVLFLVMKSWNDNAVIYEYEETSSQNPIKVTWISFEKADIERHTSQGNLALRSELNPAEIALFGCNVDIADGNRFIVHMSASQLENRVFELVMDSKGNPAIIGNINGNMSRINYAYVQMKKGFVPMGDYMNLYGINLKTGKEEVEKIMA